MFTKNLLCVLMSSRLKRKGLDRSMTSSSSKSLIVTAHNPRHNRVHTHTHTKGSTIMKACFWATHKCTSARTCTSTRTHTSTHKRTSIHKCAHIAVHNGAYNTYPVRPTRTWKAAPSWKMQALHSAAQWCVGQGLLWTRHGLCQSARSLAGGQTVSVCMCVQCVYVCVSVFLLRFWGV